SPANRSSPSTSGGLGWDRQPVAITTKRQVISSPPSVPTRHREASSSQRACWTRVAKGVWRGGGGLSGAVLGVRRSSGGVAYFSDHCQSRCQSGSKLYM